MPRRRAGPLIEPPAAGRLHSMAPQHERIGPPEAFNQPPRTGRFWFDLLAAVSAIFISVVSLVVAIRGEHTQRGLLAANSWPFVQLSEDQGRAYDQLDVENAGVGPAKIFSFEVFYKGQPVDTTFDLLQRCCGLAAPAPNTPHPPVHGFSYGQVYGNVLRPGEHIIAMKLENAGPSADMAKSFGAAMDSLTFKSCYCSVLQECWISDLRSLVQTPVAQCPVAAHPFSASAD
jgi:hypothetical protein